MKKFGIFALIMLITFTIFAGCSGCSGCTSKAERERIAAMEQARLEEEARLAEEARQAAEEAELSAEEAQRAADEARLAAEKAPQSKEAQLAAEEAQLAADEARFAAEKARQAEEARETEEALRAAEEARLAAQRALEAAQRAQNAAEEARRRAASASQARPSTYPSETNASVPVVGTWINDNKTIVFQLRTNGTVVVHEYTITDTTVDVKFETNRGMTGGGFYRRSNAVDIQSTYTGTGTYTVNKDTVSIKLSLKNPSGATKDVSLTTKFSFTDAQKRNSLKLANGFARKYIYDREGRIKLDPEQFVTSFTRQ
ncbi:MAG: hypothetical protein LBN21_00440 [Treponema sp.]|jgi:flagellar biosynthesis GTPase FlhF|nr:hypothetical protein [Treponema sp.]